MSVDCRIEIDELGQHQIPDKLKCPKFEFLNKIGFGYRRLEFIWELNFGIWNLKLEERLDWEYGGVRMNVGIGV